MPLILLYLLFALSILPTTVFFVSTVGGMLFYILQLVFLFFQLYYSYRVNRKIVLSKYWVWFISSIIISISGYFLFIDNFSFAAFYSFFSLLLLALNASLFFSNTKHINSNVLEKFQNHFHIFTLICLIIGIFQYYGYLSFSSARANYFTQNGTKLIQSTRSTSIFIEPSAWAIYYSIYLLFTFPKFKIFSLIIAILSMILSYSTTGIFLILCIIFYILFYKKYFWRLITISAILVSSGIYYLQSLDNPIINKIFFNSTDYRNVAPKLVFLQIIDNRPETLFFGNGVFSLMNFTEKIGLGERAQTTHNLFVDIFFELGIFAILIITLFLIKSINYNYKLFLILLIFISQCGYRSYQFIFLIFIFSIVSNSIHLYPNKIHDKFRNFSN